MDGKWSDFQSLIQLSITLNAAFAAFGSYAGSGITKELDKLQAIYQEVESGRAELPATLDQHVGGKGEIRLVQGRCKSIMLAYEDFIQGVYRTICIVMAGLLGIPLLIYSSYFAGIPMNILGVLAILFMYFPFYWGIWQVIRFTLRVYTEVYMDRVAIERRMIERNTR